MKLNLDKDKVKSRIYIPLIFLVFLGLLASRRWQQIVSPQVWDEDGTQVILNFINSGWKTFFIPMNGYLITISKLISAFSLSISFAYYPMVSTIISWLFIAFVGLAIALAPTKLNGRFLCAVSVFAIPSNPEVFGLPLYTVWWAALLLFLCALWDEKKPLLGLRLLFLLVGGLSSPAIVLILPILYLRTFLYRSFRAEKIIAFVATLIAIVQAFFIFENHDIMSKPRLVFLDIISKFFSNFLLGNLIHKNFVLWVGGLVVLGLIAFWLFQNRNVIQTWILFYLLMGSIGQTAMRIDLAVLSPLSAGPRYFFFPFIVIFWIFISYFYSTKSKWFQGFIGIILVVSIINAIPAWSRTHDDLHWTNNALSGRFFPEYNMPVMYDGNRTSAWFLTLPGKTYESLLEHDMLISIKEIEKYPTYPFTFIKLDGRDEKLDAHTSNLINTTMIGADYGKSILKGYRIIGSYKTSDSDTGEISLKLRRDDHLLYRSGPTDGGGSMSIAGHEQEFIQALPCTSDWAALDFSNQTLPPEFVLTIKKEGRNYGEWCAIALKKP